MVIGGVVESKVSMNRIQKFLEAEDVDLTAVQGITKEEGLFLYLYLPRYQSPVFINLWTQI
jgi:hypothetical protein